MSAENKKILFWGAIGGAALTALLYSRLNASPLALLLLPIMFAYATLFAEGIVTFRAGSGFGERSGLGFGGWFLLLNATFIYFLSFVT